MRIAVALLGLLIVSGLLAACGAATVTATPVAGATATSVPVIPTSTLPPNPTAEPPSPTLVPPSPTPLPPSATPKPPPTATQPPPPTATPGPAGIVTPKKLNVREGPSTKYPIVQTLASGTPLDIIGQAVGLNWFKIRLPDGREGWVSADLVKLRVARESIPPGYFRSLTGIIHNNTGARGLGELTIMNALDSDVLVVLVKDPKSVVSAYVRTQDSYTLTGIADGTYTLYYGEGTDWDGSEFTSAVEDHRSQDPLKFTTTTTSYGKEYSTWTVTLYKTIINGPAPVSVPSTEFPKLPPDQDKEG